MRAPHVLPALALVLAASSAWGQQPGRAADPASFETAIRPVLVAHCAGCHSRDAKEPKGDFRLEQLSADFDNPTNRERWLTLQKRVKAGEMPPKSKPRLPEKDVRLLSDW